MKDGHESCHIFMSVFQFPSFCFETGFPKSTKEATDMKNTEVFFSEVTGSWEALEISIQPDLFSIWPGKMRPIGLLKKHAGLRTFLTKKLCPFFMYCVWVWQTYPRCHLVDRESPWFGRCCSELPDWLKHPLQTHQRMTPGEKRE